MSLNKWGTNTQRTISFMCKLKRPKPGASALGLHQASHSPNPFPFWFPKLSSASLWVVSGHNTLQDLKILANVSWKCGCNRSKNTLSATRWAQDQSLPFFFPRWKAQRGWQSWLQCHTATEPIPCSHLVSEHRGHINKGKCLSTKSRHHQGILSSTRKMRLSLLSSSTKRSRLMQDRASLSIH